jgi:hypothetical protein
MMPRFRLRTEEDAVRCDVCNRASRALGFRSLDGTEWLALSGGWLFFVRNGMIIVACSSSCADGYAEAVK